MAYEGIDCSEGEFQAADGLRLYYRACRKPGVEPKRLIVTLHGFADHSGRMPYLLPHLCEQGAVVYAYDMRGNGRSEGQRGHVMDYAELLDEFQRFLALAVEREPGLERVIFAHSTGAILALTYLCEHPDAADRVILSSPCLIVVYKAPAVKVAIGKMLASVAPRVSLNAGFDPASVS